MIDKDKVVEAARALVKYMENGGVATRSSFKPLIDALNPPPPRPSKEICIDYLERFSSKEDSGNAVRLDDTVQRVFSATVDYLKEPSLQWVKNTGAAPNAKLVLVRVETGSFALCSPLDSWLRWGFDDKEKVNYFVEKYIILE
jgi:hypothetical protein